MSWTDLAVAEAATHHVRNGEPAYAERFDEVLKFHAPGLAPVCRAGEAWHIHPDGRAAYPRRFRRTFGFYEGLSAVVGPDGWRHVTPKGVDVYAARFAWCGNFQGGRCTVRATDGRYHHITPTGAPAYDNRWRYAGDFRDGIAVVQAHDGRSTHIDAAGRPIHGRWFLDLDVYHKAFARARDEAGWMHVDGAGRPIYARRFAAVEPFYNGQARVERLDGGLEVIDEAGRPIVELRGAGRLQPSDWAQVGEFRISPVEVLHRSAWGTVRGATDVAGRSLVSKSTRARHDREYEALSVLRGDPSVPAVVGRVQLADTDWLFLTRMSGCELGTRNQCVPREVSIAVAIADQILRVCESLHAAGLVHTDLHPGNVLQDDMRATVLDYEHVVRLDADGEWAGELNWGVWEFVPPEQLADFAVIDASADVYSVAVLLAYLIQGRPPFRFKVLEMQRVGGWDAVRERFRELRSTPDLSGVPGGLRSVLESVILAPRQHRPSAQKFRKMLREVCHE